MNPQLETAIHGGDIVEFRKLIVDLDSHQLMLTWCNKEVGKQPALREALTKEWKRRGWTEIRR